MLSGGNSIRKGVIYAVAMIVLVALAFIVRPFLERIVSSRVAMQGIEALRRTREAAFQQHRQRLAEIEAEISEEFHSIQLALNPRALGGDGEIEIRTISWKPGLSVAPPGVTSTIELFPVEAGGIAGDDARINAAIENAQPPAKIILAKGVYRLENSVTMKSGVLLQGAGMRKTILVFRGANDCFILRGSHEPVELKIDSGFNRGSRAIEVPGSAGLSPGQLIKVYSDNPPERVVSSYRTLADTRPNAYGQLVQVSRRLENDSIEIDTPLRLDYRKHLEPRLKIIRPIEFAGIENLSVFMTEPEEGKPGGHTISIDSAVNCWVRGCELGYSRYAHVWVTDSRFLTFENNYSHHGWRHDGQDRLWGYGLCLAERVSDCLVANNVFESLRHAVILETGANGNVVSYNYSTASNPQQNRDDSCDFSVHGFYAYMNLFEGNLFQFAESSDFFGRTGPLITFYRNRVQGLGIKINNESHFAVLVGNEFERGGIYATHDVTGTTVIGSVLQNPKPRPGYGKTFLVEGAPIGSEVRLRPSLYLTEKPSFLESTPWPCYGPDVGTESPTLPAQVKYDNVYRNWRAPDTLLERPESHTNERE